MPLSHDTILLETVRTRRARLHSALLYGGLPQRRPVTDNVRRLVAGAVLAAVGCAGCVGYGVVTDLLADQKKSRVDRPPATAPPTPGAAGPPAGRPGATGGRP